MRERLLRNVKVENNGCWIWQGAKKGSGIKSYGSLTVGSRTDGSRKTISAHRASYIEFVGEIPNGLYVCHKCDKPSCINPDHLFLGTHQDNMNDRENKNRNKPYNFGKRENHSQAKLKWKDVNEIRYMHSNGNTQTYIASVYGVSPRTVSDIVRMKTWLPQPPKEQDNE